MSVFRRARGRAFTLVELIVVVVIIAVLAALAAFGYNRFVGQSRSAAAVASATMLRDGVMAAIAQSDLSPAAEVEARWRASGGDTGEFLKGLSANYDGGLVYTPATGAAMATLQVGGPGHSGAACVTLPDTAAEEARVAVGTCDEPVDPPTPPGAPTDDATPPPVTPPTETPTPTPDAPTPPAPVAWTSAAALPQQLSGSAAATGPDGRIYHIGGIVTGFGMGQSAVYAFDPSRNLWSAVAPLPERRFSLTAVTGADGRIYAMGGRLSTSSGGETSVYAYDTATDMWTTVAPLPFSRYWMAAAAGPDGRIYAIGGAAAGNTSAVSVWAYEPATNKWINRALLPEGLNAQTAATGPDGRIYAIGGRTGTAGAGNSTKDTVYAFDPATNKWTTVAPLPEGRELATAVTGPDGRIYAIGGIAPGGATKATVYVYNVTEDAWREATSLPAPRSLPSVALGLDGRLYVMGGSDGARGTDTIWALPTS